MKYSKYVIFFTAALCSLAFALFIIHYSLFTANAQNFIGPTTGAGVGQGAIGVDSSNNLAVGTSTPQADTKLLIVGTSTTGGYFAIKVLDMNRGPLFIVRSDGSVSIGSPFVQSNQSGSTTTVSGVGTAPSNGALFVNGPIFTTLDLKAGGIAVGTTTPQSGGSGYFTGTVTAGSFSGSYAGTMSAANLSSGAFGSNTGGGNYSFPASISVSTTTAPTGGVATFMGNVGIGTTGPNAKLEIEGGNAADVDLLELQDLGDFRFVFRGINNQNKMVLYDPDNVPVANGGIMTWTIAGNVGIGTTGPDVLFHVYKSDNSSPVRAKVENAGTAGAAYSLYVPNNSTSDAYLSLYSASATTDWSLGTDASDSHKLKISTTYDDPGSGTVLTIQQDGNVGIGTTNPTSTLTVAGAVKSTTGGFIFPDATTQTTAYAGGTQTIVAGNVSAGAFGSNTGGGNYSFPASVGIGVAAPGTKLEIQSTDSTAYDGTQSPGFNTASQRIYNLDQTDNSYSQLVLGTRNSGAANSRIVSISRGSGVADLAFSLSSGVGVNAERMRITSGGNVGIGTTAPGFPLEVNPADGAGGSTGTGLLGLVGTHNTVTRPYLYLKNKAIGTTYTGGIRWIDGNGNEGWAIENNRIIGTGYLEFNIAGANKVTFDPSGNVGIGTIGPSYKLDVVGTAQFSQPVIVGTPTATGHAATKSYVDSTVGGTIGGTATNALACSGDATCEMSGANLNSGNIVGVNKLTVTTIDPLYSINGKKYSTYAASFAGGVKEEYTGKGKLILDSRNFAYTIDFDNVKEGSDLWVWYKAIEFSKDSVEAVATPYGQAADIYYVISGNHITFYGNKPAEFSFRLTGKRFDWQNWPTYAPNQDEKPSFIIN